MAVRPRSWDATLRRGGVCLTVSLYGLALATPVLADHASRGWNVLVGGLVWPWEQVTSRAGPAAGFDLVWAVLTNQPGDPLIFRLWLSNPAVLSGVVCLAVGRPGWAFLLGDAAFLNAASLVAEGVLTGSTVGELGLGPGYCLWVASMAALAASAGALVMRRRLARPEPAAG